MTCIQLTHLYFGCGSNTGGITRFWLFDPQDITFTQASATTGIPYPPYTAIALVSGAPTGAGLSRFDIVPGSGELKTSQSASKMTNIWNFDVSGECAVMSNSMVNALVNAGTGVSGYGVGVIVEDNNGNIWVMGELFIGTAQLSKIFKMMLDGTELATGKDYGDYNGATVSLKGKYVRPAIQYTGTLASVQSLEV
jgi:hypothetical protein